MFFFECYGHHRDLHVRTHSFPTRRSSDLRQELMKSIGGNAKAITEYLKASKGTKEEAAAAAAKIGELANEIPEAFKVEASLRSEEHTSELQSLMRISYAVFCWKHKNNQHTSRTEHAYNVELSNKKT